MCALGQSPAAPDALLGFKMALASGVLPPRGREQIALTIAELNVCDYCLAAHSIVAKAIGLTTETSAAARRAKAADQKIDALLRFAAKVVKHRGHVPEDAVTIARDAGASDAGVIETVAHFALNVFTN